ncbi:HNH endonuclease [Streptomyces sioyaensis]|uniref:HNH endonuclease n=1 Tax=Streptomyces sioyaensis TaxID=67364 RepID=UPI0033C1A257
MTMPMPMPMDEGSGVISVTTELSSTLAGVVNALTRGRPDQAQAHMDAIAFDWPSIPRRGNVPMGQLVRIYDRDRYTCRYCGKRTVHLAVLRMLSTAYPCEFPHHPNWKADCTHPAYIEISTSNDHVRPVSRGGASRDDDNIVTSCAGCNYRKGDLPLDVIGMSLRPIEQGSSWRGLTDLYRPLWDALNRPELSAGDRQLMRAFDRLYGAS